MANRTEKCRIPPRPKGRGFLLGQPMNSESKLDDAADAARCLWCWFWRCEHEVVARAEDWVMVDQAGNPVPWGGEECDT